MNQRPPDRRVESERVPLFGTWGKAYLCVSAIFFLDVALFYFFGRYFS